MTGTDIHVLPINDLVDHDETRTCWCGPRFEIRCPEECDGGCWRCAYTGWLDVAAHCDSDLVVIHNAADGRL